MNDLRTFEEAALRIAVKIYNKTGKYYDGYFHLQKWYKSMIGNNPNLKLVLELYDKQVK